MRDLESAAIVKIVDSPRGWNRLDRDRCNETPLWGVYISDFVYLIGSPLHGDPVANHLGEFEQLVLLTLLRLGASGYGVTVREELQRRAGRPVSLGTVYKTLVRLEAKGLVSAHIGEPTRERGGRRKKHYTITLAGRRALQRSLSALRALTRGLAPIWEAP